MTMTTSSADAMMKLFMSLMVPRGRFEGKREAELQFLSRDLVCTPYQGNYGKIGGWVVCVEGSPPKGTIIVSADGANDEPAIYFTSVVLKRLKSDQNEIVHAFYEGHLKNTSVPFKLASSRSTRR